MPISTHAPAGGATGFRHDKRARFIISTHAPAGGATCAKRGARLRSTRFLLTPLREGRQDRHRLRPGQVDNFYSRPCGRGDALDRVIKSDLVLISTHAPAGGATRPGSSSASRSKFLLTPLREGRRGRPTLKRWQRNFYSRPCGRGDILKPATRKIRTDFYSRPCGRGD